MFEKFNNYIQYISLKKDACHTKMKASENLLKDLYYWFFKYVCSMMFLTY